MLVAILVIGFSRLQLPSWEITEVREQAPVGEVAVMPGDRALTGMAGVSALVRSAVPFTLIPERKRTETLMHTVQAGDTLYGIAEKYGVSAETLMWANNMELNPDLLRLDQQLVVLPVSGVLHTVAAGDTIESIANKYKANAADIINLEGNKIDAQNPSVAVGQQVIVPGGSKPQVARVVPKVAQSSTARAPANAPQGNGRFIYPASGPITQSYKPLHRAIDIGARMGAPVKASDAGYVAAVVYSKTGYGYHVIIDHGNGFQTLYAHMSKIYVQAGQAVERETAIGAIGSTGRSTGPHLHFEVRHNGAQLNPFGYLP
jgi:murein DD-endopeptidase MepM/ murein hydrolase activator NlpD